ncbi:MAG TPA: AAA domain-containing protein, partial [Actinomycetota bacterium]
MLGEMAAALTEEARHAQKGADWVRVRNGRRLRAGLDRTLYCFDADSDLWFPPGTTAEIQAAATGDEPVVVEVLEVRGQSVWLESPQDLGESISSAKLRSNPWYLLEELRTRVDELRGLDAERRRSPKELHIVSCLLGLAAPATNGPHRQEGEAIARGYQELPANESQLRAVADCLASELRFVWGPPGTGKTETLGLLAAEAFLRGETVLVLAHSNAAVDAAALAFVRNLLRAAEGREARGEALRAWEPFLPEAQSLPVTERAVLQRSRPELIARLEALEGRGGALMDSQDSLFGSLTIEHRARSNPGRELARVTDDLRKVRDQVGRARRDLLETARLVLTTLSKAAITSEIHERRFDRVLVDEASMAQPPQVALAASLATRSLAVFGDFRQLAPVVQSWSQPVKQWLGRDVFELNGLTRSIDTTDLLSVLTTQYRMHPSIMGLVNGPSYGNRLQAGPGVEPSTKAIAGHLPARGEPVVWIDTNEFGARGHSTATHSRLNPLSAWLALQVALQMLGDGMESIGVVAPYRDQARLLRLLVRAAGVQHAVHTGTIHRFQGGERDAIILDLVDAAPLPPGVLFRSDDGLRLLNVAITRARGKLVCLSDGTYLKRSSPSTPAWTILANLCRNASPLDPSEVIDAGRTDAGWAVLKASTETATMFEHDLSDAAEAVAFEAGLPGWVTAALKGHDGPVRRQDRGARLVLLPGQAWLFPKTTAWSLRLSDP